MNLYDFDEREKEKNGMKIIIDGLKINIPEKLILEKMELIGTNRDEVEKMIEKKSHIFKKCLLSNNEYDDKTFEKVFISYLDNEMAIYRL